MIAQLPLSGIRVVDLTRALAGPMCTTLLADLGADVVKVEPLQGDMIRGWGPFTGGVSVYHLAVNRNKRSIALDLRSDRGRQVLRGLVGRCDVLVENFRPGVLGAMGLDPARLRSEDPNLIVASVTGFGESGPLKDDPSFDQIAQGVAGLMSLTGIEGTPPTRVGIPIADILAGLFTTIGVTASLAGRARLGSAGSVATSLLESVIGVLTFQAQRYLSIGEVPGQAGNNHPTISPYGVFATADVPINIAVATEHQWERMCATIGAPELVSRSEFADNNSRRRNLATLRTEIERRLIAKNALEWTDAFRQAGLPVGPIHDMAGVFADPQVVAMDMIRTVEHPTLGAVRLLRGPIRFDGCPTPVSRAAPLLGEHTREILEELGLDAASVDGLIENGLASEPRL